MGTVAHKNMRNEIKEYINHADERVLKLIYAIVEADQDWWDEASSEEKKSIELGARQLKEGKGIPHDEVVKKYSQWFSK